MLGLGVLSVKLYGITDTSTREEYLFVYSVYVLEVRCAILTNVATTNRS